jgi:hypothetical protein
VGSTTWSRVEEEKVRYRVREGMTVDGPYNTESTVKTSGSRGVYDKFHAHFWY